MKTVLIIEDNLDSLNLYGEILQAENLKVVETNNGREALIKMEQTDLKPDLIIMDLSFPYMTAEEFVENLRARDCWQSIPILVISGHVDTEERSFALRAKKFIKKPFDLEQFVSVVKNLVFPQVQN